MRLSAFIATNMEPILNEWEQYAETITATEKMNRHELRDDAGDILETIANDLVTRQTGKEQAEKSKDHGPVVSGHPADNESAAERHASGRLLAGFSITDTFSEYRALRASVLRLWGKSSKRAQQSDLEDMTRFNEAIDQAMAESLARYSSTARQSQNLFLGILGHDLRNPLNAIAVSSMALMHDDILDSKHSTLASRIHRSSKTMAKLINNLLDFTQTQLGGSIPISPTHTNLAETGEQAVEEASASHPHRSILFKATGDLQGSWDGVRVGQVLSNLIGNALEYGAENTPVTVTMHDGEQGIVTSVHNEGQAIPPDDVPHIFEPFKRTFTPFATQHDKRSHLGLGLYVVREIIQAHGGKITVESSATDGTTFTFLLPRQ